MGATRRTSNRVPEPGRSPHRPEGEHAIKGAARGAIIIATVLASLALPALAQAADAVTTINSSIVSSDSTQTGRLMRAGSSSTCAAPNVQPTFDTTAGRHYKTFSITSSINETACLTVAFNTACTSTNFIQSALYNGSFDPTNITNNEITTEAMSPSPTDSYDGNVTAGQTVVLAVNEINAGAGCSSFTAAITSNRPWASARPQARLNGSDAAGQPVLAGRTLTAQPAAWTTAVSDAFQWRSCDATGNNCSDIAGATGATFTPDASLRGKTIRVVDTANDASGTSSATSVQTGGVTGRTLSVATAGSGSGSVTSNPAGIDCGSTCSAGFDDGSVVSLTATPGTGSTFTGWSGGGCTGAGSCQVTMSNDQSVTAIFTANPPPPNTKISKAKINQKTNSAVFKFTSVGGGKGKATFGYQCALVRKKHAKPRFKACASPKHYRHLKPRRYTFEVRAFDTAGKDPTPAKKKFRIK